MKHQFKQIICSISIAMLLTLGCHGASTHNQENTPGKRITSALFLGGLGSLLTWALYRQSQAPAEALLTIDTEGLTVGAYERISWDDIRTISLLKDRENGQVTEFIVLELAYDSPRTSQHDEELSKRLGLRNYEMFIESNDVNGPSNLRTLKSTINKILNDKCFAQVKPKTYFNPPPSPAAAFCAGAVTTIIVLCCLFGDSKP